MRFIKFFLILSIFACVAFAEEPKKVFIAKVDPDGIQRIKMLGGEYFFDPNYVIVKVNIPVELSVRKEPSIVPHNIIIKAPEAGIDIKESFGSDPKIIKFTPTKTGKFPFYCDKRFLFFRSHKSQGMEGVLEVTD